MRFKTNRKNKNTILTNVWVAYTFSSARYRAQSQQAEP